MNDLPDRPAPRTVPKEILTFNVSAAARRKAVEDGLLIDVSQVAWDAGFSSPTFVTTSVWNDCVAWTADDDARQVHQDQQERLWNLLIMAWVGVRTNLKARGSVAYRLLRIPRDGHSKDAQTVPLKIILSRADDGARLLTILQPHED
jgi:hypothetical protein